MDHKNPTMTNTTYYERNKERLKAYQIEYHKKNKNYQADYRLNNRATQLFGAANARARKRGSICTITKDWIQQRLDAGVCELTGIPFNLNKDKDKHFNLYAPSLDRIDNKNPNYTPDNVRVVLWGVNVIRGEHEFEEVKPIMEAILAKMQEKWQG